MVGLTREAYRSRSADKGFKAGHGPPTTNAKYNGKVPARRLCSRQGRHVIRIYRITVTCSVKFVVGQKWCKTRLSWWFLPLDDQCKIQVCLLLNSRYERLAYCVTTSARSINSQAS